MGITLTQLTNAVTKVKNYCTNKFTHENITVLEKLTEDENSNLLYDGKEIGSGSSSVDTEIVEQVEANTTSIQTVATAVNSIAKYQNYVNTELEYMHVSMADNTEITVETDTTIPFGEIIKSNGIGYDSATYTFNLKAGKTYKIITSIRVLNNSGYLYYKTYNVTTSQYIGTDGCIETPSDYDTNIAYKSAEAIIECDIDTDIQIRINNIDTSKNITITPISSVLIEEINHQIVIDPVEYVNSSKGLEDFPVGNIISRMGIIIPKHYLMCDGREYNITDYPYLAQYIIDNYGSANYFGGDGENTFAVPYLEMEYNYFSPLMTSNSTPAPYIISASNIYDNSYNSYKAFDSNMSTEWCSKSVPAWIKIDLGKPVLLNALKITSGETTSCCALNFTIEGSNDDTDYIVLKQYSTSAWATATTREIAFDAGKIGKYRYIKITVNKVNGSSYAEFTDISFGEPQKFSCIKYEPTYFMTIQNTNYMMPTMYSEEEKVIGCWTNGKPLYQKIIKTTSSFNLSANIWNKWYNATELNIDVFVRGHFARYLLPDATESMNDIDLQYGIEDKHIYLFRIYKLSCPNGGFAVIEYTKTTDAENSFTTNIIPSYGNNSNTYTDEEVNTAITETIELLNN